MTLSGSTLRGVREIFASLADAIPEAFPLHLRQGVLSNSNRLLHQACLELDALVALLP